MQKAENVKATEKDIEAEMKKRLRKATIWSLTKLKICLRTKKENRSKNEIITQKNC
ncbi:MAG: hypothetical protein L6V93_06490 [Clostridiales bacterium]|nr:MAG: hypothetical protein L6V93_06490 [Clostridiales bacterium]